MSTWKTKCKTCNSYAYYYNTGVGMEMEFITSYSKKREEDLYFDLEKKYLHCDYCEADVEIVDFNVLIERLSEMLPPAYARSFSMKNKALFERMPEKLKNLFFLIQEEYDTKVTLPIDNFDCLESGFCSFIGEPCECIHCIKKCII